MKKLKQTIYKSDIDKKSICHFIANKFKVKDSNATRVFIMWSGATLTCVLFIASSKETSFLLAF